MIVLYILYLLFFAYFQDFFAGLTLDTIWTIGICTFIMVLVICLIGKTKDPETAALKAYSLVAIPAEVIITCLIFRDACNTTGFGLILAMLVELPLVWSVSSLGFILPACIDIAKYPKKASWAVMATSMAAIYFLTISKYFM